MDGTSMGQTDAGKKFTQRYLVELLDVADTYLVIDADDGTTAIPAFRSALGSTGDQQYLLLLEKNSGIVDPKTPLHRWVDCTYSIPPATQFEIELPPPGTTQFWDIALACSGIETVEPVDRDNNFLAIQTSAHQPFPLSTNKVYYDEQLIITFKTRRINGGLIALNRGVINDATVVLNVSRYNYTRSFPPSTLKLGNITYNTELDANGAGYFQVTLPLMFRSVLAQTTEDDSTTEQGWRRLIVDQGFHRLEAGKPVRIEEKDSSGNYISGDYKATPTFLDGQGAPLADGSPCVLIPFILEDFGNFTQLLAGIR
jgi:hypothetical protein